MMKNKTATYLTKIQNQQSTVEKKRLFDSVRKCEMAMDELKKIYWHEKQLLIVIPLLMRGATTFELVESLTVLSKYTTNHIKTLETNFPSIAEAMNEHKLN